MYDMIFASLDHLLAGQDDLSGNDALKLLGVKELYDYWLKFTGAWARKIKRCYDDHPTGVLRIIINPYARNGVGYLLSIIFYELAEYYKPGSQHLPIIRVVRVFYARGHKMMNTRVKWRQFKKGVAEFTDNTVAVAEGGVEMLRRTVS
jgi:hypothetical protein